MMTRTKLVLLWIVCALIAAAIVYVGIDDPELEQRTYCQNVKEGIWPDYEGTYKQECGGKDPPKFHENLTK